jgi:hypothetical protein
MAGHTSWLERRIDYLDQQVDELLLLIPCEHCGHNTAGDGNYLTVTFPCGYCWGWLCAHCKRCSGGVSPVPLNDMPFIMLHDNCGWYGHGTLAEQPKYPVAKKGFKPKPGRVLKG